MGRISDRFAQLQTKGEKALVLFITAGYPTLADFPALVSALVDGGADIIEVGIPFSDPIADGPVIQASSQRALDQGVTPGAVLGALASLQPLPVPVVAMGYYNPVLRAGLDGFASRSAGAGVDGTIISDLTPEESDEWVAASHAHGLDNIFLAAPTSTDARLDEVARRSTGFVYAVSRTGVTGAGDTVAEVSSLVGRIRARTSVPVCVGFGVSRPEHVAEIGGYADGVIVGSALIRLLDEVWDGGRGAAKVSDFVRMLKSATV